MTMEKQKETVILEIEGTNIECNKELLINNSDYFRAMLTGSFKESTQETIKIQDVNVKSFNTILSLLWDNNHIIDEQEIHLILQAACMLQFNLIKQLCETRIMEILKPSICLTVWKMTELLDISPHWLKAKAMSLEEFTTICDSGQISCLNLDDICKYLGNLYLNVKHEFKVFQTAMNWYYENQDNLNGEKVSIILKLLNCIDFKTIQDNEINEMQTYPDIANNTEIKRVLNCLVAVRTNDNIEKFSGRHVHFAKHFLNCHSRKKPVMPCFLMAREHVPVKFHNKESVVVADTHLRKRFHKASKQPRDNWSFLTYGKLLYKKLHSKDCITSHLFELCTKRDTRLKNYKNLFQIDMEKIVNLTGFKLISYKEFVFLYGGEYLIGVGSWNLNFWAYDTFKGKWERKSLLPQGRRHFESTIVDNCIYLIGGTGRFRVVQENMICYDFIADNWSPVVPLPSNNRSFKCCSFNGKLCLVYLAEKLAYFFDKERGYWTQVDIQVDKAIIGDFTVFADENYLYIKGNYFIAFKLENNKLVPRKQIEMNTIKFSEIETVLCNDNVYTLYKGFDDYYNYNFTFELFNLKTEAVEYIFRNKNEDEPLIDSLPLYLTSHVLFLVNYYPMVKDNICINNDNIF